LILHKIEPGLILAFLFANLLNSITNSYTLKQKFTL